jgi:hypothetical protein
LAAWAGVGRRAVLVERWPALFPAWLQRRGPRGAGDESEVDLRCGMRLRAWQSGLTRFGLLVGLLGLFGLGVAVEVFLDGALCQSRAGEAECKLSILQPVEYPGVDADAEEALGNSSGHNDQHRTNVLQKIKRDCPCITFINVIQQCSLSPDRPMFGRLEAETHGKDRCGVSRFFYNIPKEFRDDLMKFYDPGKFWDLVPAVKPLLAKLRTVFDAEKKIGVAEARRLRDEFQALPKRMLKALEAKKPALPYLPKIYHGMKSLGEQVVMSVQGKPVFAVRFVKGVTFDQANTAARFFYSAVCGDWESLMARGPQCTTQLNVAKA